MNIDYAKGMIDQFATIFHLDNHTEVAYDGGTPYLVVDMTDRADAFVLFDYYPSSNVKMALESDSADLQKLIETKLYVILDAIQPDPEDDIHCRDYPITD